MTKPHHSRNSSNSRFGFPLYIYVNELIKFASTFPKSENDVISQSTMCKICRFTQILNKIFSFKTIWSHCFRTISSLDTGKQDSFCCFIRVSVLSLRTEPKSCGVFLSSYPKGTIQNHILISWTPLGCLRCWGTWVSVCSDQQLTRSRHCISLHECSVFLLCNSDFDCTAVIADN